MSATTATKASRKAPVARAKAPTIIDAITAPDMFGPHFKGNSWGPWKTFLSGFFGLKLTDDEATLFRQCTGRQQLPAAAFEEATLICGRRAGKSRVLALLAVYLAAFRDYEPFLAPGEVATIAVLASDRKQARSIFRYAEALVRQTPLLSGLLTDATQEQLVLSNRVVIEISTASFRATRGYTYGAVLCDEIAFWRSDETSANPDREILRALRPGLGTIPGAPLLIASSPYAKKGELYASYKRDFGNDASSTLCWKAPTLTMHDNTRLRKLRDEDMEKDPQSARAEWDGEFRDDLADFVTLEMLEAVTAPGRHDLPPMPSVRYQAFCDPSGGVSDSMTLAVAHLEDDKAVLDAVLVVQPPFDPAQAVAQCAALMKRYGIVRVKSDRYAGQWVVSAFASAGITVEHSERSKSDIYMDFLPLVTGRSIQLLDHVRVKAELASLERRTARSGKDSVDHAPGQHDDLANAVAGVLVGVMLDRREPLISRSDLIPGADGAPALDDLGYVQTVYATIWVSATGDCGWGLFADPGTPRLPMTIIDFGRAPWRPAILTDIAARMASIRATVLEKNSRAAHRGVAVGFYVQHQLLSAAERALMNAAIEVKPWHVSRIGAIPIETHWIADPVRLVLSASHRVDDHRVQLSAVALERCARVPLEGLLEVMPGQVLEDDALRLAMLMGIAFTDIELDTSTPSVPATMMRFG